MTTVVAGPAESLLRRMLTDRDTSSLTHLEMVPARLADPVEWPDWVPAEISVALRQRGVEQPWRHQADAADFAHGGRNVVVATGTASGKSLAYQVPALTAILTDPRATVLYLAPTKALAADQLRMIESFNLSGVRPACYDGDTPRDERDWVRQHSRFVLTNADMVHHGILSRHRTWSTFLRRLAYVVVDECHTYRGVFGSHIAHVLRRLRRVTARYGGKPVFVLASATSGDPAVAASRLIGAEVTAVTTDASPRGAMSFALWEPPLVEPNDAAPPTPERPAVRRSALREAAGLLTDAVASGVRTLVFVKSRRGAEAVAAMAREALVEIDPELGDRVAAYRSGYLREERRGLERALDDGTLTGLATTSALELGVDLVGLDAVILAGFPGRLASLWQQAGRAGRAGQDALCMLIARNDPLDMYLVHNPRSLFGKPVESCVLDPTNPYILEPHLAAAAYEQPLTRKDLELFGGEPARAAIGRLVDKGLLRARPGGWYWVGNGRPDVDLRGTGGDPVDVVESATGRLLGTVDHGSAHFLVHPGAVYIHQGMSYVVEALDLADAVALVRADEPPWSTHARDVSTLSVLAVRSYVDAGPVGLYFGDVEVAAQVVSYQRRKIATGEVIDTQPLDLPERRLQTVAVWWTISLKALANVGVAGPDTPGALHAAEHAAIGLLPLVASCDRWDIGGLSTAAHPDTDAPTVFVYDGHPGGAGFAERAYDLATDWLAATRAAIAGCGCAAGCPACIQSPKCGNGNSPLDKTGAIRVLDLVLESLPAS